MAERINHPNRPLHAVPRVMSGLGTRVWDVYYTDTTLTIGAITEPNALHPDPNNDIYVHVHPSKIALRDTSDPNKVAYFSSPEEALDAIAKVVTPGPTLDDPDPRKLYACRRPACARMLENLEMRKAHETDATAHSINQMKKLCENPYHYDSISMDGFCPSDLPSSDDTGDTTAQQPRKEQDKVRRLERHSEYMQRYTDRLIANITKLHEQLNAQRLIISRMNQLDEQRNKHWADFISSGFSDNPLPYPTDPTDPTDLPYQDDES